ncbi:MAG TPA: hypothetical protein VNS58_30935 [Puia sp.]|nr:hypothetical protein [Puia sp.]
MKIQEYIASGIIESYALGLASAEEVAQIERLLPFHPQLRDALSDFEFQLELFALEHSGPPPPGVREKILDRLRELPAIRPVHRRGGQDGRKGKDSSPEYIPIEHSSTHIRVHKYWRPAFIAIFILAKILLACAIYYFIENQHAQKDIRQLQEKLIKTGGSTTEPGQ